MIRVQFKILLAWKQEVNTDQCVNGMPGLTLQFKNRCKKVEKEDLFSL